MDSLMGWNLKDWRSYGGEVRDMEIVDLMGATDVVKREEVVMCVPWKADLGFEEREEVRVVVVAMAAIEGE